jgi:hypothetical protein
MQPAKDIKKGLNTSVRDVLRFIGGLALLCGLVGAWNLAADRGYIFHDTLTSVSSKTSWVTGEYKDCFSTNVKTGLQLFLACDNALGGDSQKTFMVRFWGVTHSAEKPENTDFNWKCRKNGDGDPAITCEQTSRP